MVLCLRCWIGRFVEQSILDERWLGDLSHKFPEEILRLYIFRNVDLKQQVNLLISCSESLKGRFDSLLHVLPHFKSKVFSFNCEILWNSIKKDKKLAFFLIVLQFFKNHSIVFLKIVQCGNMRTYVCSENLLK